MNKYILAFLLSLISFTGFSQTGPIQIFNNLELTDTVQPWINRNTIREGDAFSGRNFSRTDAENLFGLGWKGPVPSPFYSKNISLKITSMVRMGEGNGKVSMVISVMKADSVIFWVNKAFQNRIHTKEEWIGISDEIELPSNLTSAGRTLLVYLWNEEGSVVCDLDDMELRFSELNFQSWMVPDDIGWEPDKRDDFKQLYDGTYFRLLHNNKTGRLIVESPNGKALLDNISVYSAWSERRKRDQILRDSLTLRTMQVKENAVTDQGAYFNFIFGSGIFKMDIELFFPHQEPILEFRVKTIFNRRIQLERLSLSFQYGPELKEVYRHSSLLDTGLFQEEYWLGKGGFQVYSDSAGFILYHPQHIGSVQLSPPLKKATVNIDWEMDHPLLHWPLRDSAENRKENRSASVYDKGDSVVAAFSIQGIRTPRKVPRISKFPQGKKAALIWTEHADYSDIKLQRAVNFGADTILNARDAVAGFAGHRIPVTKSVFYSNPDSVLNSVKAGFMQTEVANYSSTAGFRDYLHQLDSAGQEICLHTPDHFTTNRNLLEEALSEFRKEFNSVNWIDHGYDNALKSNRENLACDGLVRGSKYYSLDLWKKYGIKYAWNCFYEDTNLFTSFSFNSFMSIPYHGWGDRFPVPVYWSHPTRSADLVHWRTSGTLDPPDAGMWNYFFDPVRLYDLMAGRGTAVMHVYPSRADSTNGFYHNSDGVYLIRKEFDEILARQAALRDEGYLHLVSVRDHLDYNLAIEKLEMKYLTNGQIRLENKSGSGIKGLSLLIPEGMIGVRGKQLKMRQEADETVFWFDLNADEVVYIDVLR